MLAEVSAQRSSSRPNQNSSSQTIANVVLDYKATKTHQDVSDLILQMSREKCPLGIQSLDIYEMLVGAGIGIKAIAPCIVNLRILVLHGEVRLCSYLRIDEDCDLLSPSSETTIKAGQLTHLVTEVVTIEAVSNMSSLLIGSFIYL